MRNERMRERQEILKKYMQSRVKKKKPHHDHPGGGGGGIYCAAVSSNCLYNFQ